ncbi:MAG: hypothetical protein GX825_01045 [Syntrophomonadaceae bacterium]|nr:hypothetical protein [Syntrophomonadaceae bacterium]
MESLAFEANEGEVSFATDHFTIYVVGEDGPFTATYEFYVGNELVDTQIVKNNEKLLAPPIPEIQGQDRFLGWKVDGDQNYLNFDNSIQVTENANYDVRAVFDSNLVFVFFIYQDDVITTKEVVKGQKTNADNVALNVTEFGKAFSHWSSTENGSAFSFNNPINEDTNLYAVLADRH